MSIYVGFWHIHPLFIGIPSTSKSDDSYALAETNGASTAEDRVLILAARGAEVLDTM
jgi:hypothetical protein